MQQALFQRADTTQLQVALDSVIPGHGTGVDAEAANEDEYLGEISRIRMTLSVIGNVLGGAMLLACMYFLPYVSAAVFGS